MASSFRLFVSSTFRDFDTERDALRQVEASLRDRLLPYGATITLVDLRWGVFAGAAREGDRELEILQVCLREVEETRPLFVGLVGDRYGWVPDARLATAAAARVGLTAPVADASVTELEIEIGVLQDPGQAARSVFFFRRILPAPTPQFADSPGSAAARRLERLKERIESTDASVVRYDVEVGAGGVVDIGSFVDLATERLWDLIVPELDIADRDRSDSVQQVFIDTRSRYVAGRGSIIGDIVERARGGSVVVVTGPAGQGKSAVLARLAASVGDTTLPTPPVLFHNFGLGPESSPLHFLARAARMLAAELGAPIPPWARAGSGTTEPDPTADEGDDDGGAADRFGAHLDEVLASGRRLDGSVLWVLDAIDECDEERVRSLLWLPDPLPSWLRVVASSREWQPAWRRSVEQVSLPGLEPDAARDALHDLFSSRSKAVPDDVVDILLGKRLGEQPACASPLWTVLVAETLIGLDVFDFARLGSLDGDAEARLVTLLRTTAEAFPVDSAGMYRTILDRAARGMGREMVDGVVQTIGISRFGIPPRELSAVLSRLLDRRVSDLELSRVRWSLAGQVEVRGELGEWDTAHLQLREVVTGDEGPNGASWSALHATVGAALAELEEASPFRDREVVWHLLSAGDRQRIVTWLAGDRSDGARKAAATCMAEWLRSLGPDELGGVLAASAGDPDHRTVRSLLFDVDPIAQVSTTLERRRALLELISTHVDGLLQDAPDDATLLRYLGSAAHKRGRLEVRSGDLAEARRQFDRALTVRERRAEIEPDVEAAHRDHARTLSQLGDIDTRVGAIGEGRVRLERALAIREGMAQRWPDSQGAMREVSVSLSRLGDLELTMGDVARATELYGESLAIRRRLREAKPRSVLARRDVSVALNSLSEAALRRGDADAARRWLEEALDIRREIHALDPTNARRVRDLALSQDKLCEVLIRLGDLEPAETAAREAMALRARLLEIDPENAWWQRDMSISHRRVADVAMARGDHAGAQEHNLATREIAAALVARDPANARWRRDLRVVEQRLGDVALRSRDLVGARARYESAFALGIQLMQVDDTFGLWRRDLLITRVALAAVALLEHDEAEVVDHVSAGAALARWDELDGPVRPTMAQIAARVTAAVGSTSETVEGQPDAAIGPDALFAVVIDGLLVVETDIERARQALARFGAWLPRISDVERFQALANPLRWLLEPWSG